MKVSDERRPMSGDRVAVRAEHDKAWEWRASGGLEKNGWHILFHRFGIFDYDRAIEQGKLPADLRWVECVKHDSTLHDTQPVQAEVG